MNTVKLPIGPIQLFCLLFQAQFGLGILSLPHSVDAGAGADGWIACLFGGLLNFVLLFIVWQLSAQERSKTVLQIVRQRLGPYVGFLFNLAFALYAFTICYESLENWIFISNSWALERTPAWVLAMAIIGVCTYLVSFPPRILARFAVFATAFVPLFILLICYTLKDADLHYVMPLFSSGFTSIAGSSWQSMMSYVGIEILLVLSPCFQMPSKTVLRTAMICNISITAVYVLCVFSSTVIFGSEMISYIREPLLFQFKTVSFQVIERMDLIVLTCWIMFIISTLSTYLLLFVSAVTAIGSSSKGIPRPLLLVSAFVLFGVAFRGLDISSIARLQSFIGTYVPMAAIGLPALMLLMIYMKKWLAGGKGVRT